MLGLGRLISKFIPILALVMITACSSKSKIQAKQSEIYFSAGTQSLMEKQYTDALKNLIQANKLDPDNSEILNNLGMAYYFKGEKNLAIQHLNRSLEIDSKNSDAKTNLASIYFKEGKINEAETLYLNVLKDLTYEKQARTLYNLGVIELQTKKNLARAEKYFKKSIKEDENYCPSHFQLGVIQFKQRKHNTALKTFKQAAMGTCYDSPAPHYYQALALIQLSRYEEARIKLDEIDTRFKNSSFAKMARVKTIELNQLEKNKTQESHASRKMLLESPDF